MKRNETRGPWWKLPKTHPLRIRREFEQARAHLRRLKAAASAEMSEWEWTSPLSSRPTAHEIAKAQETYDRKRAAWEAAGSPTR